MVSISQLEGPIAQTTATYLGLVSLSVNDQTGGINMNADIKSVNMGSIASAK